MKKVTLRLFNLWKVQIGGEVDDNIVGTGRAPKYQIRNVFFDMFGNEPKNRICFIRRTSATVDSDKAISIIKLHLDRDYSGIVSVKCVFHSHCINNITWRRISLLRHPSAKQRLTQYLSFLWVHTTGRQIRHKLFDFIIHFC